MGALLRGPRERAPPPSSILLARRARRGPAAARGPAHGPSGPGPLWVAPPPPPRQPRAREISHNSARAEWWRLRPCGPSRPEV